MVKHCIGRIPEVTQSLWWVHEYVLQDENTIVRRGNSLVICDAHISNGYIIQTYNVQLSYVEIYLLLTRVCDVCMTVMYSVDWTMMETCMSSMIREGKS